MQQAHAAYARPCSHAARCWPARARPCRELKTKKKKTATPDPPAASSRPCLLRKSRPSIARGASAPWRWAAPSPRGAAHRCPGPEVPLVPLRQRAGGWCTAPRMIWVRPVYVVGSALWSLASMAGPAQSAAVACRRPWPRPGPGTPPSDAPEALADPVLRWPLAALKVLQPFVAVLAARYFRLLLPLLLHAVLAAALLHAAALPPLFTRRTLVRFPLWSALPGSFSGAGRAANLSTRRSDPWHRK